MITEVAQLDELVKFMRRHGILEFEREGLKLKLSESIPNFEEEKILTEEELQDAKEESLIELEDRLLLESPSDYERLKTSSSIDTSEDL